MGGVAPPTKRYPAILKPISGYKWINLLFSKSVECSEISNFKLVSSLTHQVISHYSSSNHVLRLTVSNTQNIDRYIHFHCSMLTWPHGSVHPQLSVPALLIHQRNPELTKPPHNAALLIPDPNQQYEEFFVQFFSWTVWGQWSKRDFKFGFQVMMWDSLNVNVSPSFTELLVSVGGVSVRSGHDSGWDPLSLSGRGFICICHVAASSRAII